MKKDSGYKDYIVYDVLGHIDEITARAMFGGWGIYKSGVIVGIIAEGVFYLKKDGTEEEKESTPFQYKNTHGTLVTMPYMSAPESLLENPQLLEKKVMHLYVAGIQKKKE